MTNAKGATAVKTEAAAKPGRGRPRSVTVEAAIIAATAEMMLCGRMSEITAELIARKAGVSKATLYKWWPNKTHLILDVLCHKVGEQVDLPDTGSALEDFVIAIREFVRIHKETAFGAIILQIIAEGMHDPDIMAIFRERFFWKRRGAWHAIWNRGVARGELRGDIDTQMGVDMIYGPPFMRLISSKELLTYDEAEAMVRVAFRGLTRA